MDEFIVVAESGQVVQGFRRMSSLFYFLRGNGRGCRKQGLDSSGPISQENETWHSAAVAMQDIIMFKVLTDMAQCADYALRHEHILVIISTSRPKRALIPAHVGPLSSCLASSERQPQSLRFPRRRPWLPFHPFLACPSCPRARPVESRSYFFG